MKVFIGCSSKDEIDKKYFKKAKEISEQYSTLGYDLVFGGVMHGLMKEVCETFKKNNRKVTSIIDEKFKSCLSEVDSDEEIIVSDICERSKNLASNCDLAIFLPGGYGTIAELAYLIDIKRNKEVDIDIIIVNDFDFFTPILMQYENIKKEKFGAEENIYKII